MNEEINQGIVSSTGGLGPMQNISGSGLGQISQQPQSQDIPANQSIGGYQKNSSLAMFELANAEKQKAKEMFYENEAMKAKGIQQELGAENQTMKANQDKVAIDNSILNALENGQIDDITAGEIFNDSRISDITKQKVADSLYPATTPTASDVLNTDNKDVSPDQTMNVDNELSSYNTNANSQDIINAQNLMQN